MIDTKLESLDISPIQRGPKAQKDKFFFFRTSNHYDSSFSHFLKEKITPLNDTRKYQEHQGLNCTAGRSLFTLTPPPSSPLSGATDLTRKPSKP
jgi:hypothetical protein